MTQLAESRRQSLLIWLMSMREMGLVLFTLVLVTAVTLHSPRFFTFGNIHDMLLDVTILSIVAVGQMMVVITKGIDLSVGSGLALSGMLVGMTYKYGMQLPPLLALLLGALIGLLLGSVNGLLVCKGKVPPIITTLGTMAIYRGLVFIVSGGRWVSAHEMSREFIHLARGTVLGIPNLIFLALLTAAFFYYYLGHTKPGREIYAIGGNADAARVAGVNVERIQFSVYALSGLLYGAAGVLWVSRYASAQSDSATGFELSTVAAIVIGGVSIFGGTGRVTGVLLGALLLGIIENALNVTQTSPFWKLAIQGMVILLAVVLDELMARRGQQRTARGGETA